MPCCKISQEYECRGLFIEEGKRRQDDSLSMGGQEALR